VVYLFVNQINDDEDEEGTHGKDLNRIIIKIPFPIPSDQFRKHLKISLFVNEDTDPGRERL